MLKLCSIFTLLFTILFSIQLQYQPTLCTDLLFLPMPKILKCDLKNTQNYIINDPCKILFYLKTKDSSEAQHVHELIKHQMKKSFHCYSTNIFSGQTKIQNKDQGYEFILNINITDSTLRSAFTLSEEAYTLQLKEKEGLLQAPHYVGFVRALQTFFQAIECDKYKYSKCSIKYLPLSIEDEPAFLYRSMMIDTSRHFLPISTILETIDALMYNKMNILHWHITDEDSFPLKLDSHPEIAEYAAFSQYETYTSDQARQIVRYAMVRGVRIVPQLDTPGHASSWSKAPKNKEVACTKGDSYIGPLDVTLDKTYKLIRQVFGEIFNIFPDPYVHLGGDEVQLICMANKTEFLEKENIKQEMIQIQYRKKQHNILKELNSTKKFIYWIKDQSQMNLKDGDVVHWWGKQKKKVPKTSHPIILSNVNSYYIDTGVGNKKGVQYRYGYYFTWLDLYSVDVGQVAAAAPKDSNILGVQLTLWSEISNVYTHHTKMWIRSSSVAERLWTKASFKAKPSFFRRITAQERLMNRRGIPTAPATCQQCEYHPEFC